MADITAQMTELLDRQKQYTGEAKERVTVQLGYRCSREVAD